MTGVVTDGGLKAVVDALIADDTVKYIGWGGGSGQGEDATDLASPFDENRAVGTMAAATTGTTDDTLRLTGTISATAPRTVTEVGVFTAPTGAELKVYGDFTAVDLQASESMTFTIDVVVDQA